MSKKFEVMTVFWPAIKSSKGALSLQAIVIILLIYVILMLIAWLDGR